jgi:hypothetical protein
MIYMLAAAAMAGGTAQSIPLTAERWDIQGPVVFETRDGKPVMRLGAPADGKREGGVAIIKDLEFSTGVVEYDVLLPDVMEFSGPLFRQGESNTGEFIYFRPHQNGKPDAIQYTPIVNGSLSWQIFTGPGFEAETRFPVERWAHIRLDLYQSSAALSVGGKAVLHMPALKSGVAAGALGFGSLMGGTYYADVKIQPIPDYADLEPPPAAAALPKGAITAFEVSEALTQDEAYDRARQQRWAGVPWHRIAVESNGIANLSKAGPDGEKAHSFIARFEVSSPTARTVPMQFGFSDDVRVYLNGVPLYEGSDRQGSRDYRFLGHAGFWDTAFLSLKAGVNQVALVVTDPTNGGTAAGAILGE